MIQRFIFLLCVLAAPSALLAQVTISAQLPPAGLVQKDQLWNLVLVNNREDVLNVNVRLNVQDAVTGEMVMSANSGMLLLNKGVKLVGRNDIQPVLYNYNRNDFSKGFLPMGSYVACYQLYATSDKGEELLGDECVKINIDPLSPPMLTSPADKSEVITPYPQFSWVPPAPLDMFSNLNYELLVTEVLEGQSPTEAIQQNTPVYTKSNLTQPFESYASSFNALKTEKTYAWQVVAKNESEYAVKTDVWTFKIRKTEKNPDIVNSMPYALLQTNNYEKAIAPNGFLKISYNNRTADKEAVVEVFDISESATEKKPVSFKVSLIPGINNIQYDLKRLVQLDERHEYIARIVNSSKETWFIKFSVKNFK